MLKKIDYLFTNIEKYSDSRTYKILSWLIDLLSDISFIFLFLSLSHSNQTQIVSIEYKFFIMLFIFSYYLRLIIDQQTIKEFFFDLLLKVVALLILELYNIKYLESDYDSTLQVVMSIFFVLIAFVLIAFIDKEGKYKIGNVRRFCGIIFFMVDMVMIIITKGNVIISATIALCVYFFSLYLFISLNYKNVNKLKGNDCNNN